MHMHVCVYIYIYIYREREREQCMCISISISLSLYIYIYIYIPTLSSKRAVKQGADRNGGNEHEHNNGQQHQMATEAGDSE